MGVSSRCTRRVVRLSTSAHERTLSAVQQGRCAAAKGPRTRMHRRVRRPSAVRQQAHENKRLFRLEVDSRGSLSLGSQLSRTSASPASGRRFTCIKRATKLPHSLLSPVALPRTLSRIPRIKYLRYADAAEGDAIYRACASLYAHAHTHRTRCRTVSQRALLHLRHTVGCDRNETYMALDLG